MTLLKEFVLVEVKHMVVDMKLKSKRAEKYSVFLFGLLISILPEQIKLGEILEVSIIIKNLGDEEIQVTVKELVGDADPINPPELEKIQIPDDCRFCIAPPFYSWSLTLNPGETKTITYKIKPKSSGDFLFSPTTVTVMAGETYYSDTAKTIVRCNQNNLCELGRLPFRFRR